MQVGEPPRLRTSTPHIGVEVPTLDYVDRELVLHNDGDAPLEIQSLHLADQASRSWAQVFLQNGSQFTEKTVVSQETGPLFNRALPEAPTARIDTGRRIAVAPGTTQRELRRAFHARARVHEAAAPDAGDGPRQLLRRVWVERGAAAQPD